MSWEIGFDNGPQSFSHPAFHESYHKGTADLDSASQRPSYGPTDRGRFENSTEHASQTSLLYSDASPGSPFSSSFTATEMHTAPSGSFQVPGQYIDPIIGHEHLRPTSPFLPVTTLAQRFYQPWHCQRPVNSHGMNRTPMPVRQPLGHRANIYSPSFPGHVHQQETPQRWVRDSSRPSAIPLCQQIATASQQAQESGLESRAKFHGSMPPYSTPTTISNRTPETFQHNSNSYTDMLNAVVPPRQLPFARQPKAAAPLQEPCEGQEKRNSIPTRSMQTTSKKRKSIELEIIEQSSAINRDGAEPSKKTARKTSVSTSKIKPDVTKQKAAATAKKSEVARTSKKAKLGDALLEDRPEASSKTGMIAISISTTTVNDADNPTTDSLDDPSQCEAQIIQGHEGSTQEKHQATEQSIISSDSKSASAKPAVTANTIKTKPPGEPRAPAKRKELAKSQAGAESTIRTRSQSNAECQKSLDGNVPAKRKAQAKVKIPATSKASNEPKAHPDASSTLSGRKAFACNQCRAKKRKCEGGAPVCLTCVLGKQNCTWRESSGNAPTTAIADMNQPTKDKITRSSPSPTDALPMSQAARTTVPNPKAQPGKKAKKQSRKPQKLMSTTKAIEREWISTQNESGCQPETIHPLTRILLGATDLPAMQAVTPRSTTPDLSKLFSDVEALVVENSSKHRPSLLDALITLQKVEDALKSRLTNGDLVYLASPAMFPKQLTS